MEKKYELLQYLINHNEVIANVKLQEVFNISRRTVTNYINQLNDEANNLIISTPFGYKIGDFNNAAKLINQIKEQELPTDYESRKYYLLKKILFSNKPTTIDELADELFISINTLNSHLNKLKKELKDKNLFIKTKDNHLYIIGDQKDKRKYMIRVLDQELDESQFSIESIQKFFNYVNLYEIQQVIDDVFQENEYFLDDFSKLNYVLHLGICIESKKNSYQLTNDNYHDEFKINYSIQIMKMVEKIYNELINIYKLDFTLKDIADASILMSTRVVSKANDRLSFAQLEDIVGLEIQNLMIEIIDSIYNTYGVNLKNDNFMIRFTLHIKNVVLRLQNSINIPNNSFITIKDDFPFLYLIATHIASMIADFTNMQMNENEISYIALHLGVLMEEKKAYNQKISCTIVIYDYYNLGQSIFQRITDFTDALILTNIVTSYDQIRDEDNIDLILTTLPINITFDIPQIKINLIPTKKDIESVLLKVSKIQQNLSNKEIIKSIKQLFKRDLFFSNTEFTDYEDTIKYLCNHMKINGYVNSKFEEAIFDHESKVTSAYGNIAVPHPLAESKNVSMKSTISILLNKKPIQWLDNQVNFVFMISLKQEDKNLFREVFDLIIKLTSSENTSNRLKKCNDYDSFVNLLIEASTME